jgi:hypothetical protein
MFARKIRVVYKNEPCPMKWLDNFSMRNFTNDAVFDDTIPVSDGVIEIGSRVPLERLKSAMEDWFRKKGYIGKEEALLLEPVSPIDHPPA